MKLHPSAILELIRSPRGSTRGLDADVLRVLRAEIADTVASCVSPTARVLEITEDGTSYGLGLERIGAIRFFAIDRRVLAEESRQPKAALDTFDLCFHVAPLTHPSFEGHVGLLRAMARRSHDRVLAVIPNPSSYWWRLGTAGRGRPPRGGETCETSAQALFSASGLSLIGERALGAVLTGALVDRAAGAGLDERLRADILATHDSALLPPELRGQLVAILGSLRPASRDPLDGWSGGHDVAATSCHPAAPPGPAVYPSARDTSHRLPREAIWWPVSPSAQPAMLSQALAEADRAIALLKRYSASRAYLAARAVGQVRRDTVDSATAVMRWLSRAMPSGTAGLLRDLSSDDPLAEVVTYVAGSVHALRQIADSPASRTEGPPAPRGRQQPRLNAIRALLEPVWARVRGEAHRAARRALRRARASLR